jgi:dGTPase
MPTRYDVPAGVGRDDGAARVPLRPRLLLGEVAKAEEPKAFRVVRSLFLHFLENPADLPEEYRAAAREDLPQTVTDYIAGMTDRFAIREFERLFVPVSWRV